MFNGHLIKAIARLLAYPQLPERRPYTWMNYIITIGPMGPNVLLFLFLIFVTLFCFVNKYYYRPPFYGSAPIALRSEWLAMATLPFL